MHGLVNRSFEVFLRTAYGAETWAEIIEQLDPGFDSFEAMLPYDDGLTRRLVDIAAGTLDKPAETLLEDFGTFMIADPVSQRVRRLLRFGGVDYLDFLHSLDDLPGRVRLALPDLEIPQLELRETGAGDYVLTCTSPMAGAGHVFLGMLRAMADDYGALVLLDHLGHGNGAETLSIRLLDERFAEGRDFSLSAAG